MNCDEARLRIGAEPGASSPGLAARLHECAACRDFQREMVALEGNIRRALELKLHTPQAPAHERRATREARQRWVPGRRWALAASLLVALSVGALIWGLRPADALAAEVVAHVAMEPASWSSVARAPQAEVDAALSSAGIGIDPAAMNVVYARTCTFRGRKVPHLVVTTGRGAVTVLVLAAEHVESPRSFSEGGYTGVLLPAPRGSIAVLARGDGLVDDAARSVMQAIRWVPASTPGLIEP